MRRAAVVALLAFSLPILFLVSFVTPDASAGTTGKITGKVVDKETNGPLPGVNILIVGTTMGAATDVTGDYFVLNVPVGTYSVRASFVGYQTVTIQDIRVAADFTTIVNFDLPSEAIEVEEIIVSAKRELIQKDATSTVTVVEAAQIQTMPVRSFQQAMVLSAGFVENSNAGIGGGDNGIHLRGARTGEITYIVDGVRVDNPLFGGLATDITRVGVSEFTVLAGTFNAEYGQAQSGVVNIVTQEGKDKYTGSARFSTDSFGGDRDDWGTMQEEVSLSGPLFPGVSWATFFGSADWHFTRTYLNSVTGPRYLTPGGREIQRQFNFGLFNNRFRGTGKLTFKPLETLKIQTGAVVTKRKGKEYDQYFKEYPEFNGIDVEDSQLYNLSVTHTLSPSTFYEFKASYFDVVTQHYLFEEQIGKGKITLPDGSVINASDAPDSLRFRRIFSPVTNFAGFDSTSNYEFAGPYSISVSLDYAAQFGLPLAQEYTVAGGEKILVGTIVTAEIAEKLRAAGILNPRIRAFSMDDFMRDARQITKTISLSISSQVNKWNLVKVGIEYKSYKIKDRIIDGINDAWNYIDDPNNPAYVPFEKRHFLQNHYNLSPEQFSAYIQDKLEIGDFIFNLGLRFDYLDAKGPNILNALYNQSPGGTANPKPLHVKAKKRFSPRLGFAFPITDKAKIHVAYGQFFDFPDFARMYARFRQNNPLSTLSFPLNTINLSPGLWPVIGNPDLKPETSHAYELGGQLILSEDLVGSITVFYKDTYDYVATRIVPVDPVEYTEIVNLDYANSQGIEISLKKRFSNHHAFAINYTFSRAEGNADSWASFYNLQINASVLGLLAPNKIVTLPWDQTHTLTFNMFVGYDTWGINFIGNLGSGFAYTPRDPRGSVVGEINSGRLPWTSNVDVRVYKTFRFGFLNTTLFADIQNVFNKRNVLNVFGTTGQPDFTTNPNVSPENTHRPQWFGPMRHILVGVEVGF